MIKCNRNYNKGRERVFDGKQPRIVQELRCKVLFMTEQGEVVPAWNLSTWETQERALPQAQGRLT